MIYFDAIIQLIRLLFPASYIQYTNIRTPHLVPKITEDSAELAALTVYQQQSWSGTWWLGSFQQIHY